MPAQEKILDRLIWCSRAIEGLFSRVVGSALAVTLLIGIASLSFEVCGELLHDRIPPLRDSAIVAFAGFAWLALDLPYIVLTWIGRRDRERGEPLAVFVGRVLPRWPVVFRPIVFLWWFAHFGVVVCFAYPAHFIALAGAGGSMAHRIALYILTFVVTACVCSTANGFLVVAIASLTRRTDVPEKVWKVRHLVDVCVALVVCLLPVPKG